MIDENDEESTTQPIFKQSDNKTATKPEQQAVSLKKSRIAGAEPTFVVVVAFRTNVLIFGIINSYNVI